MGRKKIDIKHIPNQRVRQTTFLKRRAGIYKKLYELCSLTGCKATLLIEDERGAKTAFSSHPEELAQSLPDYLRLNEVANAAAYKNAESEESEPQGAILTQQQMSQIQSNFFKAQQQDNMASRKGLKIEVEPQTTAWEQLVTSPMFMLAQTPMERVFQTTKAEQQQRQFDTAQK